MFKREYYTDCPNPAKDPEDPTKFVCNWHGTPFKPSPTQCVCPNCGYMWSISDRERNYGGGYRKRGPSGDGTI